jgi:hypothetical protein
MAGAAERQNCPESKGRGESVGQDCLCELADYFKVRNIGFPPSALLRSRGIPGFQGRHCSLAHISGKGKQSAPNIRINNLPLILEDSACHARTR